MSFKDVPERQRVGTYPLQLTLRILYSDMDAFRHVNNVAILRHLEEGRADMNVRVFGASSMTDPPAGLQLLFASLTVDYLSQAHYPGMVQVCTGLLRVGNSSYVQAQAAFQNERCFAVAEGVMVKAVNGHPTPLSEIERSAMKAFQLRT